jgi:GMP synthase (glutamine-hydrolysing)
MRVALVYHCPQTTHRLDDALREAGASVERFHVEAGDAMPGTGFDRAIILGGAMGANDVDLHPWLDDEKRWIRNVIEAGTPLLGICLGSQLMADALGGKAYRAAGPEVSVVAISLTDAGLADPVLSHIGPMAYALHQDTFTLPPGGTLLAYTERFPQAFRLGSGLALQFHPDADREQALEWGHEDSAFLEAAGIDYDEYARALTAAEPMLDRSSRALFAAWLQS